MRSMTFKEMMDLQVEIIVKIDGFCKQNGIRYLLAYGTLIGAVRHRGYIPWDDDVDLAMPRPDYERFIRSFNGAYENLRVVAPELNWNFYAPYANVYDTRTHLDEGINNDHRGIEIGVKVDIFPIDGTATDEDEYKKDKALINRHYNRILAYKRHSLLVLYKTDGIRGFLKALGYKVFYSPVPYGNIQKKINALSQAHPFGTSEYADNLSYSTMKNSRVKKDIFESYSPIEFEGHRFMSVSDYDSFLRKVYGNYMELPPVEKRVGHHSFNVFWKD